MAPIVVLALSAQLLAAQVPSPKVEPIAAPLCEPKPPPNVLLIVDGSCSMGAQSWNSTYTPCAHYAAVVGHQFPSGPIDDVRAALTGCLLADDGILDRYSGRARFALRSFSSGSALLGGFGGATSALEASLFASYAAGGGSNLTDAISHAQEDFNLDPSADPDAENVVLLISDGAPNGIDVSYVDVCGTGRSQLISAFSPELGASFAHDSDAHCALSGMQRVSFYVVQVHSFPWPDVDPNLLAIAQNTGGELFEAAGAGQMMLAIDRAMIAILAR